MKNPQAYLWNLLGKLIPQVVYLGTTIVLARFLTPEDFGTIGVLAIFFAIANTLMEAGLGGSLIKEKYVTAIDYSTIFVFNIIVSHILYVILFISAGLLEDFFGINNLTGITRILCLVFIINAWGLVPNTILFKEIKFKELTIISVSSVCIAAAVAIVLAIMDYRVYALVGYQLTQAFAGVILRYYYSRYQISFKFRVKNFKRLFSFAFFSTVCSVIDTLYENILTFLFGKFLSVKDAGFLDQAKKLEQSATQSLSGPISNVSFPILAKLKDDKIQFNAESNSIFKNFTLIVFPLFFTVSIYSEDIVTIIYGNNWILVAPYLSVLMFAGVFHIMETLNRTFIKSLGMVDRLLWVTIWKRIAGLLVIFLSLLISPMALMYGYVASTFIGFIFNLFLYGNISEQKSIWLLGQALYVLLPGISLYIITYLINCVINTLYFQLIITVVLLLGYYLLLLPQLGEINILSVVGKWIRNHSK